MKLIIAIVRDSESDHVSQALTSHDLRVTGIASSGGFLRRGKSTLLIGLEDDQVDKALQLIRGAVSASISDGGEQRAVIFVVNIDHFDHF